MGAANHSQMVRLLLTYNPELDACDSYGLQPIHYAVYENVLSLTQP